MWQQFLLNGIIAGSSAALVSVGYWIVFRTSRFFNFTYGAFVALGAYGFLAALDWTTLPPLVSIILALSALIAFGLLCELVVFGPLREMGGRSISLLIVSIGLYVVVINCISLVFGDDIHSFRWWAVSKGYAIWGLRFTAVHILIVVVSWFSILVVCLTLYLSRIGLRMRAVAADITLARTQGLSVNGVCAFAMCLSAGIAGLSGLLSACEADMAPNMGLQPLLMAVIAVVIGRNSIWLTAFAALSLAVFQNVGVIWIPTQWQETLPFVVFVLFLVIRRWSVFGQEIKNGAI